MGSDSAYYGNRQQYDYEQDNGRDIYPDQRDYYDDGGVRAVGAVSRGVASDYQNQRGGGGNYPPSGSAAQMSSADAEFQDMRQRYDEDY
jgi:hypothetical protein